MYPTSEQYKNAIDKATRTNYVDGVIKTVGGTVKRITDGDIVSGSLSITNQCVSSDAFQFGAVVSAEMGIALKTGMDRYTLYDSEISLSYHLLVADGEYEEVPLGVFYTNEPNRSGRNITIKALDSMTKLDAELAEGAIGTPFELLSLIADRCGVVLGQTLEQIRAMPNGEVLLSVGVDRVGTYRDLLSYLAMLLCGFGMFDRVGKLVVRQYGKEPVKTIQAKNRKSGAFSDFTTYYYGLTAQFVNEGVYASYTRTNEEHTGGLLYSMGGIPIVQGTEENNKQVLDAVYDNLMGIEYVPCSVTVSGDAALDLGDMVINVMQDGSTVTSLVTYYNWKYRGNETLKSAGTNPRIKSIKDKTDKQLANLEANISTKDVVNYSYTNAKKFTFSENDTEIIIINYATVAESKPIFIAVVPVEMDLDGIVEFNYYLDGVLMKENALSKYFDRGKHFITLMIYMTDAANARHKLSVMAKTAYYESDARRQEAELRSLKNFMDAVKKQNGKIVNALADEEAILPIKTLEPDIPYEEAVIDKTIPTAVIEIQAIKAVLYAQGLSSTGKWDGTINISEEFGTESLILSRLQVSDFITEVRTDDSVPVPGMIAERFYSIPIPTMQVDGFGASNTCTIERKEDL